MTSPLIDAATLAARLRSGPVPALLDIRYEVAAGSLPDVYAAGHLPGAAFVDLDRELSAAAGPRGRHPLPDPEAFAVAMRAAGIDSGRPVVVYDEGPGTMAARAWWLLRYHGHRDVRLLDGGFAAWGAAGGEVQTGPGDPRRAGDFTAAPGAMPVLDADGAAALAASGVLLDARQPERYRGEIEPVDPVAGHIPGARNRSTRDNVTADGRFADAGALREAFAAVGAVRGVEIGSYCGSGVTAAHQVLALELAGLGTAALYPGSWSEWVADPRRPVATGPEPGLPG